MSNNQKAPKVTLAVYVRYINARRTVPAGLILVAKTKIMPPGGFRVIAECSLNPADIHSGTYTMRNYNEFATSGTTNRFFQPERPGDANHGRPDLGCVNTDYLHRYCAPDSVPFYPAAQNLLDTYKASQDPDAPRIVTPADEPGRVVSFG